MKKSNAKILRNAVILIAILAAVVCFYILKLLPDIQMKENTGRETFFAGAVKDDIRRVDSWFMDVLSNSITNTYRTVLENRAGEWLITYPVTDRVDPEALQRMLGDLLALKSESILTNPAPALIVGYGWDNPASVVRVTLGGGRTLVFVNGGMATTENLYYTLFNYDSNRVYMVYAYKFSSAERSADELRDRDLFHITVDRLESMEIKAASGRVFIFKRKDAGSDQWSMLAPQKGAADPARVKEKFLDMLTIAAFRFRSLEANTDPRVLARYRLDRPLFSVRLCSFDGATNELYISGLKNAADLYYAYVPGRAGLALLSQSAVSNKFEMDAAGFLVKGR